MENLTQLEQLNLTILESEIVKSLIPMLYAEPGFSDVDVHDLKSDLNISTNTLRGGIGSLVKKGILFIDKAEDNGSGYDLIHLSEKYWYLHSPSWAAESRF